MEVFFLFLIATSVGALTTLYWVPEDDLGRGYFQMNALIILCLLGLALAVYRLHPFQPFGERSAAGAAALGIAVLGAFLYYACVWRERWHLGRAAVTLTLLGAAAALLLAGWELGAQAPTIAQRDLLLVPVMVSSALLLGWSLITMLLGHWYLVAPKLAFRHLVIFCWVLLAVVILRLALVGAAVLAAANGQTAVDPQPLSLLLGFDGQGMFFWFRVLWGLAIPLTLALMSLHCARHRSNQSATGILYVLVVGAFVGEITAFYIMATTGIPI